MKRQLDLLSVLSGLASLREASQGSEDGDNGDDTDSPGHHAMRARIENADRRAAALAEVNHPSDLRRLGASYITPRDFAPGELVIWKDGMRNRRFPTYGSPMVCVDILDLPPIPLGDTGSDDYLEPLNTRCGIFMPENGEFTIYTFDGARLQKYDAVSTD